MRCGWPGIMVSGFLVSLLSFRGRKGGCGGQDPGLRVHPEGFRGGQIGDVRRVGPDILNHVEDRGLGVIGDVLEEVRGISAKMPEGARGMDLSLDWTGIRYYGKYVEGLGSGDKGY